jgi:hypothetical protein
MPATGALMSSSLNVQLTDELRRYVDERGRPDQTSNRGTSMSSLAHEWEARASGRRSQLELFWRTRRLVLLQTLSLTLGAFSHGRESAILRP